MHRWFLAAMLLCLSACQQPTHFLGEAKVPGGAAGCEAACGQRGMQLAGMVVMGEYSDGCICQVRGATSPPAVAAAGPAIAGVMLETRQREARRQQQQSNLPK